MNNDLSTIYTNITNAVNFQVKKSPAFDQLINFQNSIKTNLILPNPYESSTADFIDNFSVKLIKNILNTAISDLALANILTTILENYVQIMIYIFDQPNLAFLEAASQITNPNNIFYTALSQNNLPPYQYNKIVNHLKTKDFYQNISNFFETHEILTLKQISLLINLLISVKENSENYNTCICFVCQKAYSMFSTFNFDDIREIDDKLLNSTLNSISSIESKYLNSDYALNLQLQINIRFAKSDILEKRFNGINQIVGIIKNESNKAQNQICKIVNDQQILDGILNDFHNQLVNPFVSILTQFIQNKIDVQNYLIAFWKVSINQHSSIAPEFFAGWKNLISNQPIKQVIFSQYSEALFETISGSLTLEEATGKEASFTFLNEISSNANEGQKEKVFNALLILSSIENVNLNLLMETIPHYMPKNSENIREIIIKQSLEMIKYNHRIQLVITLISNIKLNQEQSNNFLSSVIDVLNKENSLEILPLLFKLLKQYNKVFEDNQFEKIMEIYLPQLNDKLVIDFLMNTISISNMHKMIYSHKMKKILFKNVCEITAFNDQLIPLVINLFDSINMKNKNIHEKKGLDLLWSLSFRTKNEGILEFIRCHTTAMHYVEKCMNNIQTPGALQCLYSIIKKKEPNMNNQIRNILKMPLINEYIDEDLLFPVTLNGAVEMTLFLTYGTNFSALKFFISLFLKINRYVIYLYVNGKNIAKFDEIIKGPLTINVKVNNPTDKININYESEIPTLILFSNATYTLNLMNLLEDEQQGETVLKILNNMPTLSNYIISFDVDEENNQIDESNDFSKYQWDWNKFLSFTEPNHLIYHLNTIGNNLNYNNVEWNRWLFYTGGVFKIMDLLLKTKDSPFDLLSSSDQKKFTDKDYLLLLFVICKILLLDLNDEINDIIEKIDDELFISFLNYSSNYFTNDALESISYYLLVIIENITLRKGISDKKEVIDSYIQLFELSCFHKSKKVRTFAADFIHKKEIQAHSIIIQLLPKAISKNNLDFINSIISIAKESKDQNEIGLIWNTLLDSTFSCFAPLKNRDINGIWQNLNTAYPQESFIQDLLSSFTCLIELFQKNNIVIPRIDELYFFLFDDILYNQIIYFQITPKLISILSMIIQNKPSLIQETIPRIKEIQKEMTIINNDDKNRQRINIAKIKNNSNDGPDSHIKGLRNLGATCYMASLLQQLYAIPIFRSSLLNLDLNIQEEEESLQNEGNSKTDINDSNKSSSNNIIHDNENNQNVNNDQNINSTEININENTNNEISTNEVNNNEINNSENNNVNNNEIVNYGNSNEVNNNEISNGENNSVNNNEAGNNANSNEVNNNEVSNSGDVNRINNNSSENNNMNDINENVNINDDQNANGVSNNQVSNAKNVEKKDNYKWLYELQYLFLKMLIYPTSSSSIDPSNFVHEWKGWDGNPINPHHQQDAEEYLSLLFSRLEPKLSIVDTLFKGQIKNHFQGQGKYHNYNKYSDEDFFDIGLEVKGHKNIASSFEAYKSPNKFEGQNQYVTDELGPIDAIQTHLILHQSPILILTLKRFQFNMKTLVKEKITSKYEFPLSLDISPILANNKNDNNNDNDNVSSKYELYGVVLHKGTADAGHYISHIKGWDNNWLIFNDAQVQIETKDDMFSACYGGMESIAADDGSSFNYDNGSAYILFYRRVDYNFNCQSGFEEGNLPVSPHLISRLSEDIKKDILTEIASSEEYFKFISSIIEDPEFLLSLLSSKSGVSEKCRKIIMNSCINKLKSAQNDSTSFAEIILFYYSEKSADFIANDDSDVTQDMITNNSLITLVKEALCSSSVPNQSSYDFLTSLVSKINEIESINETNHTKEYIAFIDRKLEIYANNLLSFYEIVRKKDNQIDTSQMVTTLVDFLSKNQGRNTGSIVNLLIKMDSNNRQENNNISSFFNDDMLMNYFLTDETKEILSLTVKRIKADPSKLDLLFSLSPNAYQSPMILSKLFICIISSKNTKPQTKLKMSGIENKNYMEIYFSELIRQKRKEIIVPIIEKIVSFIPYFVEDTFEKFIFYSDILVEKWLLSFSFDVRRVSCTLFLKYITIDEASPKQGQSKSMSLYTIYNSLIKRLDYLQTCVFKFTKDDKNDYHILSLSIQVEHYFYILAQVINYGRLNLDVIQQSENLANFLTKASKPFEKYREPCFIHKYVLDFITATVKKENAIEFFGSDGEILIEFLSGLPLYSQQSYFTSVEMSELETYADTYIKFIVLIPSKLFYYIANSRFLFEILKSKKFMQNPLAKDLYKHICKDYLEYNAIRDMNNVSNFANLFFTGCLNSHLEAGRIIPIKIAIFIMNRYPELSNFMYNNGMHTNVWDFVSRKIKQYVDERSKSRMPIDTSVFPLLNLLGVFITKFSSVPSNKSSNFFMGSYYQNVSSYFEKCLTEPFYILQFSVLDNNPNNLLLNSKGSFVFLNSLFVLSLKQKKYEQIYEALLPFLNYENGFISHIPMKAKPAAADFMLTVLRWATKTANLIKIGFYANRIQSEFASYISSIFQRDTYSSSSVIDENNKKKITKIDQVVLAILAKESYANLKYINTHSINKLFEAFRSLMLYSEAVIYFISNDMLKLCISIMIQKNYVPFEWIQNTQEYILNIIKKDYSNESVNEFVIAANIIDTVIQKFNIPEVPKIVVDQQARDNINRWKQTAQRGRTTSHDDFVLIHLFTILDSK